MFLSEANMPRGISKRQLEHSLYCHVVLDVYSGIIVCSSYQFIQWGGGGGGGGVNLPPKKLMLSFPQQIL